MILSAPIYLSSRDHRASILFYNFDKILFYSFDKMGKQFYRLFRISNLDIFLLRRNASVEVMKFGWNYYLAFHENTIR